MYYLSTANLISSPMTEQTEEEWEREKYLAWNKFNNLRSMTTSDMCVSDEDRNVVALILGERLFLNSDYIEAINGTYTEEERPEDGDDPVTV